MDSGDEDELTTGSREFIKEREKLFKAGYVEGATRAEEHLFHSQSFPHHIKSLYMKLGKLIGVVEAAIDLILSSDSEQENLFLPFLKKMQSYSDNFFESTTNTESIYQRDEAVTSFISEFKILYPDAAILIESLFDEDDKDESGGDLTTTTTNKLINGISVDMNKLRF